MKFCQKHWEDLKQAIKDKGMWDLVAIDGHAALYMMKQELEGSETDSTYDPLMAAHNMISAKALEYGGLYLMTGDYCPLCELISHAPGGSDGEATCREWIKGSTDACLAYCQEHKLIPLDKN